MEYLIKKLIGKMQELDPKLSNNYRITMDQILHTIENAYRKHLYGNLPYKTEYLIHIQRYFIEKTWTVEKLLDSRKVEKLQCEEILDELAKNFDASFSVFISDPDFTSTQKSNFNQFLKQFHTDLLENEYFTVLNKRFPGLATEIFRIINSFENPESKNKLQKQLKQLRDNYHLTPSGQMLYELEDFDIFLNQCIWVIDSLNQCDAAKKLSVLNTIPAEHIINENELQNMILEWLACPALLQMQDDMFELDDEIYSLGQITKKIQADLATDGPNTLIVDMIKTISTTTDVAIDVDLDDVLNKLKENEITRMLLFVTIMRLVNKAHEEETKDAVSFTFTTGDLALMFGVKASENNFFIKAVNDIERKILIALDHNISFKDSDSSSHRLKHW